MSGEKLPYLDRPGRSKNCKGERREKPSVMDRIRQKRTRGPEAVANYIFGRRHEILSHFDHEPERLETAEWAVLRRLIRELSRRQSVRQAHQDEQSRQARELVEKAEAIRQAKVQAILDAEDRADAAARSDLTLAELRGTGLTPAEIKVAGEVRRRALRPTGAAQYLGIPKSRLDTWCREGLIDHSFTRSMAVTGAGTVAARHFLPEDLDKIDMAAIERRWKAIKGRGKLKLV